MLVFLVTEFTSFIQPDLISIGMVAEDGREFYAELTDYRRDECSDFLCDTVLPLLGRVPGAACHRPELTRRVRKWFEALPEPATIVFDYERDWLLLDAYLGSEHQKRPANVGETMHLDRFAITHLFITRDGKVVSPQGRTFATPWRATQLEMIVGTASRGLFLHVEHVQLRSVDALPVKSTKKQDGCRWRLKSA
jgi:hypothetical protein